jgi:UDP-N-acetylglucosamine enolpyruvyl transferase
MNYIQRLWYSVYELVTTRSIYSDTPFAGAALVCAALSAEGTSYIDEARRIDRGYEKIVEKLRSLGADIEVTESTGYFVDKEA